MKSTTVVDSNFHTENVVYLRGKWTWEQEGVKFASSNNDGNSAVIMKYNSAKQ